MTHIQSPFSQPTSSVEESQVRIALFPGTFDPFTVGHESLVKRALTLVDKVIIAIGVNESKKSYFPLETRLQSIRNYYKENPRVDVSAYQGLTVDFAEEKAARFILRGIRTVSDFEYEKNIADLNRMISGVETFLFFTEPEFTHISSTHVRELLRFGYDVGRFLPQGFIL